MHTRASNSELVEPSPEPERTLNRRLRRRNRRVPYDQRNNPPQHPRIAADHVVAPTLGSAITITETANEFAIKGNHLTLVKGNQFDDTKNEVVRLMMFPLLLTGEAKTWLDELNEGTIKTWDELRTTFISRFFPPALFDRLLGEIRAFFQHENESLTDAWLHMKEMLRNCHGHNLSKGNIIKIFYHGLSEITQEVLNATAGETFMDLKIQLETVAKNHQASIQNFETKFDRLADKQSGRPTESLPSKTQPNPKGHNSKAYQPPQARNEHVNAVFTRSVIRVKQKQLNLRVGTERMIFNINSAMKHSYSNDDTCFSIDVIDEILEEDSDALLDEGSKILHSIEGTLLEEEIFAEFDEFMAMTTNENSDAKSDIEELPFEKIITNTDYKIKTSLEEPPTDLELKPLPDNLEFVFLEEPSFLPVIISSKLSAQKKSKLVYVLKKHKEAFAGKTTDIPGICPSFCKHKIQLLDDKKPVVQKQRRLNLNIIPKALISYLVVKLKTQTELLKEFLKTVKDNPAIWLRKLDDALWAFRITYKTPTGTTPYKLIYGKNCHLPFEIEHRAYWALKNCNPDLIAAGEKRMFQLYELDELRHQALKNSRLYKARTKVWHGRKLRMRKEFKQGNKVLLFHSKYKFKQPKLKS
ncbi:reverse transcriptase domain-containing protein [Tanacetum coccineum]|uniref:Reverse transcriptase domain-containing protein n=1 Tax=Tanacetum coccineum TaxID=301880 RepID=A0ABQ4ZHW9_9ASTR